MKKTPRGRFASSFCIHPSAFGRKGEVGFGRAVSRILSASLRTERIICLSDRYPKPVRFRGRGAGSSSVSNLALHPMGFSVPCCLRFTRCAFTAPFHPYHAIALAGDGGRSNFLWHCPSASLPTGRLRVSQSNGLGLRSIAPCGVRTFLPGLAPGAILRPSKTGNKITGIPDFSSNETFNKNLDLLTLRINSMCE